jgi:Photosystem I reaction centre subunit XI
VVLQATGPFIKLGPLRNVDGVAEIAGSASAAGLVLILTACLTIYGAAKFQQPKSEIGVKTLSGACFASLLWHSLIDQLSRSCLRCGVAFRLQYPHFFCSGVQQCAMPLTMYCSWSALQCAA